MSAYTKLEYGIGRAARSHYLRCCEAVGIKPDAKRSTVHEALVAARPERGFETLHPLIAPDLKAAQITLRNKARELLRAGKLGAAQVSGTAHVGLIFRPGRNLVAFLSGSRLIFKWDEQ